MKQAYVLLPFLLGACTVYVSGPITGVNGSVDLSKATATPSQPEPSPTSKPSPTPDTAARFSGLVAFVHDADANGYGNLALAELNPDDQSIKTIREILDSSGNAIKGAEPVISPDGRKIAFVDYSPTAPLSAIRTIDADGNTQTIVSATNATGYNLDPTWSSSSQELAFVSDRDGNFNVYRIQVGEGNFPVRVTNTPVNERFPAWNPSALQDRTSVMVVSTQMNNVGDSNSGSNLASWNLFLLNIPDGRYLKQLTDLSDPRDFAFEPEWTMGGQVIAYTRYGPILDTSSDSQRYQRIYIQDVTKNSGSGVLLNRSETSTNVYESSPVWNKGADQVAYLKSFSSNKAAAQARLWRQTVNGISPSTDSPKQWIDFSNLFPALWFSETQRRPFAGRSFLRS